MRSGGDRRGDRAIGIDGGARAALVRAAVARGSTRTGCRSASARRWCLVAAAAGSSAAIARTCVAFSARTTTSTAPASAMRGVDVDAVGVAGAVGLDQGQAVAADRGELRAAGDQRDISARRAPGGLRGSPRLRPRRRCRFSWPARGGGSEELVRPGSRSRSTPARVRCGPGRRGRARPARPGRRSASRWARSRRMKVRTASASSAAPAAAPSRARAVAVQEARGSRALRRARRHRRRGHGLRQSSFSILLFLAFASRSSGGSATNPCWPRTWLRNS